MGISSCMFLLTIHRVVGPLGPWVLLRGTSDPFQTWEGPRKTSLLTQNYSIYAYYIYIICFVLAQAFSVQGSGRHLSPWHFVSSSTSSLTRSEAPSSDSTSGSSHGLGLEDLPDLHLGHLQELDLGRQDPTWIYMPALWRCLEATNSWSGWQDLQLPAREAMADSANEIFDPSSRSSTC